MSIARFLLALACSCTSAGIALAGGSAVELELALAREPSLYLRVELGTSTVQVMVRGMELDRFQARSIRLLNRSAAATQPSLDSTSLPRVWHVTAAPEDPWRRVVAPPTLVPYQEDAPPPTPIATATPVPELPEQYHVELDDGWSLHLGPHPPGGRWQRLRHRMYTGWLRITGRPVDQPSPAIVIAAAAEDSRRMLHILREGTAVLVLCGDGGSAEVRDDSAAGAAPAPTAASR